MYNVVVNLSNVKYGVVNTYSVQDRTTISNPYPPPMSINFLHYEQTYKCIHLATQELKFVTNKDWILGLY